MSEPRPGLYESLVTEALASQLEGALASQHPQIDDLRKAEAADRIAWHIASVVEKAIEAFPDDDKVRLGVPLARSLTTRGGGELHRVPLTLPAEAGEQAAFVAFTEALGSLAPNTVVVDVDGERGVLLVHTLAPTGAPAPPLTP